MAPRKLQALPQHEEPEYIDDDFQNPEPQLPPSREDTLHDLDIFVQLRPELINSPANPKGKDDTDCGLKYAFGASGDIFSAFPPKVKPVNSSIDDPDVRTPDEVVQEKEDTACKRREELENKDEVAGGIALDQLLQCIYLVREHQHAHQLAPVPHRLLYLLYVL